MKLENQLLRVTLYASAPVAAAIAAGGFTTISRPSDRLRSYFQHFAAGCVFSALGTEVLADIVRRDLPFAVVTGFTIGVLAMLGIRALSESEASRERESSSQNGAAETKASESPSSSLIWITGIDVLIDGLLLGLGFSLGQSAGFLLTVGLGAELISLGTTISMELNESGVSRAGVIIRTGAVCVMMLVGAAGGVLFLSKLSVFPLEAVLAFAAATLLFLVTEELLVEAHEISETPLSTAMFFVGFLLILMLRMFSARD